ncbi:hypothetical protein [Nocardiopsis suaedae]|uniref:Secreted protein n=1 Tax=Nocardiopsis suaedae TaxID=3018444 RepID=A0ABT4TRZ6_9ACTN|nr:hypothetical protein [Nocardiopsis suaedae]MDA2807448.1 hypothetical protein [Nocardiopsis suaedae]
MRRAIARTAAASLAVGGALTGALLAAGPAAAETILAGHYGTAIGCDMAGRAAVKSDDWTIGYECDHQSKDTWILYLVQGPSPA